MAKWLNKKTGKVWDVHSEDVLRMMKKSPDYEEVTEVKGDGDEQVKRQEQGRQTRRRKKEVGEPDGGQPGPAED